MYWSVRDAEGYGYDADYGFSGHKPALGSDEVVPGRKVRGLVVIDVPANAGPLLLELSDPLGKVVAEWAVDASA